MKARGASVAIAGFALAMMTIGCAPGLLWYGHDPTRLTRWELRTKDGQTWLQTISGASATRRSASYDEIVVAALVWNATGRRFAVPARRGSRWHMLVDGDEGPAWTGVAGARFSADGAHVAYAAEDRSRWTIVRDGRAGVWVDAIVEHTLGFSPSGNRLGYAAELSGCVRVFADATSPRGCYQDVRALFVAESAAGDTFAVKDRGVTAVVRGSDVKRIPGASGPSEFAFDPRDGRWAMVGQANGRAHVQLDGQTLDEADEIRALVFSPSGQLSYVAREGAAWHFVLDGKREGPRSWIRSVTFSPSGRRHAYVSGLADGRVGVFVDGPLRAGWSAVDGLVFSADERRFAYAVRSGAQFGIVCDDVVFPFDVVVETSIGFSANGRHWGAIVGDRQRRRLSIVVDGQTTLPFDSEELFGAASEHTGDASGLRSWVTAELDQHARGGAR